MPNLVSDAFILGKMLKRKTEDSGTKAVEDINKIGI